MSSSASRLARWAWLPAALAIAASCRMPSEEVDAGDLLGVFSRDAGPDASAQAKRKTKKRDAGAAQAAVTPPAPSARGPVTLPDGGIAPSGAICAAAGTEPSRDVKRTIGRPACREAQVSEWQDAYGSPRYACTYLPKSVEARAPLPLVLFFHDGLEDPTMVRKRTRLAKLASELDMTGDPAHRGFVVLAVQGRLLDGGKRGAAFDVGYAQPDNVDVVTVDHFLAELEQKKLVDLRRVYALGIGTGGEFAEFYSMMRPDRVAAFGAFAAGPIPARWSCGGPPPPALFVYRACDAFLSCDEEERFLRTRDELSAETAAIRLGAGNDDEPNCAFKGKCSQAKGQANHRRWPKGREEDFLKFFAKHVFAAATSSPPEAQAAPPP